MKKDMINLTLAPLGTIAILTIVATAFSTPAYAQSEREYFDGFSIGRSEEHTSELQSRSDLVCRLLLEKKKKKKKKT